MTRSIKFILPVILFSGTILFVNNLHDLGSTYDESFSYIRNSSYLVRTLKWDQPYINLHPPLMYYIHGWPFLFFNSADQVQNLFISRLAGLPFFVAFGVLIYWFVSRISRIQNAILASILYFFNIELLAHSRLSTADFIQAFTITLTVISIYFFLKNKSKKTVLATGVSFALALLSKHSALILVVCLILIATIFLVLKKIEVKHLKKLLIAQLIAFFGVHAGYFFKESGKIPTNLENEKIVLFEKTSFLRPSLFILPRAYLQGADTQLSASQSVWWGYFNGKQYLTGLWYFYFAAFILKTQIPFLILLLITAISFFKKRKLDDLDLILIIVIATFFIYFSFFSKLIIGLRYILPIYPLLIILISKNLKFTLKASKFNILIIILLITYFFQALNTSGHFIEYTNEIIGGPKNAYKYFADSNLDWNQNQTAFEKYLKNHAEIVAVNPKKPISGIIAVNVNEMNLYYYQDYLWLRRLNKDPIGNVGFTWLIFKINPEDII